MRSSATPRTNQIPPARTVTSLGIYLIRFNYLFGLFFPLLIYFFFGFRILLVPEILRALFIIPSPTAHILPLLSNSPPPLVAWSFPAHHVCRIALFTETAQVPTDGLGGSY